MKDLEHPFNNSEILRRRKFFKKLLLNNLQPNTKTIKIAILGGGTGNVLAEVLEIFLLKIGVRVETYLCEFNRYYEEIVFDSGKLWSFSPDIIYINTTYRDFKFLPSFGDDEKSAISKIESEHAQLRRMWETIKNKSNAIIIQNNYELPSQRIIGNSSCTESFGLVRFVSELNLRIACEIRGANRIYLNDLNYLASDYGLVNWFNEAQWASYKYPYDLNATTSVAASVASIVNSQLGQAKKCLVLDLDNTLWGGVIGDDGLEGIIIGNGSAEGEAYLSFQKYLLQLKNRGILLAVCTKNELTAAQSGFTHKDSILKLDDFVSFKASWEPKEKMIREIAQDLNIGLNSLVLIDDNPAERKLVKEALPMVEVPDVGLDVTQYVRHIENNRYFESLKIVSEDLNKHLNYKANESRAKLAATILDYKEYLLSLNMQAEIKPFDEMNLDRIVQLVNKTNQFNISNMKVDDNKISEFMNNKNRITLQTRLSDTFGDNGIVSLLAGEIINGHLVIDLWVMSCRVFKRNLEHAILDEVIKICRAKKINEICGVYYKTEKNNVIANLYQDFGFVSAGDNLFKLILKSDLAPLNQVIKVNCHA